MRTRSTAHRLATFRLDVEYLRIAPAFSAARVSTILLKGPAFDQLLFGGVRSRSYSDIDVLVDPAGLAEAGRVLERLGFRRAERQSRVPEPFRRIGIAVRLLAAPHGAPWVRERDGFTIDLHETLPLIGASPGDAWLALSAHHATVTLVDSEVTTLDRAASALLIALHAAHHGRGWSRAQTDLRRACELLERDCWDDAVRLARVLRAEAAMGTGLGTVAEGVELARELGLRTKPTIANRLTWFITALVEHRRT